MWPSSRALKFGRDVPNQRLVSTQVLGALALGKKHDDVCLARGVTFPVAPKVPGDDERLPYDALSRGCDRDAALAHDAAHLVLRLLKRRRRPRGIPSMLHAASRALSTAETGGDAVEADGADGEPEAATSFEAFCVAALVARYQEPLRAVGVRLVTASLAVRDPGAAAGGGAERFDALLPVLQDALFRRCDHIGVPTYAALLEMTRLPLDGAAAAAPPGTEPLGDIWGSSEFEAVGESIWEDLEAPQTAPRPGVVESSTFTDFDPDDDDDGSDSDADVVVDDYFEDESADRVRRRPLDAPGGADLAREADREPVDARRLRAARVARRAAAAAGRRRAADRAMVATAPTRLDPDDIWRAGVVPRAASPLALLLRLVPHLRSFLARRFLGDVALVLASRRARVALAANRDVAPCLFALAAPTLKLDGGAGGAGAARPERRGAPRARGRGGASQAHHDLLRRKERFTRSMRAYSILLRELLPGSSGATAIALSVAISAPSFMNAARGKLLSAPRFIAEAVRADHRGSLSGKRTLRAALSHAFAALHAARAATRDHWGRSSVQTPLGAHVVRLVFVAAALVENRPPGAKWIDADKWRRRLDAITCTDDDDLANVLLAVQAREALTAVLGARPLANTRGGARKPRGFGFGSAREAPGPAAKDADEYAPGGLAAGVAPHHRDETARVKARARLYSADGALPQQSALVFELLRLSHVALSCVETNHWFGWS